MKGCELVVEKKKKDEGKSVEDELLSAFSEFEKKQDEKVKDVGDKSTPIKVKISPDKLRATVNVASPVDLQIDLGKNDVVEALKKAGVTFGIDEDAIEEIFTYGSYGVDVPVARAKLPTDGTSAKIDYKFDITGEKKAQIKVDEHGNVDFKDLDMIKSMEQGSVLAVKIPAVMGEAGMTVTGETLPPKEGRDVKMPVGENVEVSENGMTLLAAMSGQPIYKDGKVSISAVYEIKGDVSYVTGNVNFKGTVIIHGGVQSDFIVSASDNVEITGNIEKAFIEAGGDVLVRGGLYGQQEGKIVAGGSVTIRSVESGIVEAGKNIIITQSSRYSTLLAGEDIILNNQKGTIVGGKTTAGRLVDVSNIGSPSFTETPVEVGINPKIKELQAKLETKVTEDKQQLEKVAQSIKALKEMQTHGPLAPDKVELMKKLVPVAHQLRSSLETDTAKLNFVYEKLKTMQAGRLKVKGKTYPGVKIFTAGATMTIRKELNHSSFYEQNEQIIVGPY
ncbi:MAG: FapA family protein [bacterium]